MTAPYRAVLQGTCYECEDHTVAVEITETDFKRFQNARKVMAKEKLDAKAMIFYYYPEVVLEGWSKYAERTDDEIFKTPSDVRVDYSELHLWHDGDLLWRYGIKHVDGKHWEACWVTWAELEKHFEPKEKE